MGFVTRRVGNQARFIDLLRHIVALRNEKIGKMSRFPIAAVESSIIRQFPRRLKNECLNEEAISLGRLSIFTFLYVDGEFANNISRD